MLCDLHIHTTCSDGCLSPAMAVNAAAEKGVSWMAVTDHDTLSGVPEAEEAARPLGLRLISGVELSSGPDGETHILAYGIPPGSSVLSDYFRRLREERNRRALRMLRLLEEMGIFLDRAAVEACSSASIGRPHIARMLVAGGHCRNTAEAFDRYLAKGRPVYVPREYREPSRIIRLVRSAGGIPVLAHPALLHLEDGVLEDRVARWRLDGLLGLEVYHPSQTGRYAHFAALASRHRLLITGGSDFHDPARSPAVSIGCTAGAWRTAEEDIPSLLSMLPKTVSTLPGRENIQ